MNRAHLTCALALTLLACSSHTPAEQPDDSPPSAVVLAEQPPQQLRVLTYNVFLRPEPISFGDKTSCRAERIGNWLARGDVDVVALTETFQPDDVDALTGNARDRFPHQVVSQPDGKGVLAISGGLSILSRWPIESTRTHTYSDCSGPFSDCVAAKGALHAVVRVSEDSRLNVVTTHLDAGDWGGDRKARAVQFAELRSFMDEIDPDTGPTVLLGDFNVDALAADGEYEELLTRLGMRGQEVRDASTLNCKTTIRCEEPVDPPERLDYVFSNLADLRMVPVRTEHLSMEDRACGSRYLSDHRAVRADFNLRLR